MNYFGMLNLNLGDDVQVDDVQIEMVGIAEQSSSEEDEGYYREADIDGPREGQSEETILSNCSTANIRKKIVNGVCYCQMCCGGTWYYFYRIVNGKRVYQKCGDSAMTVKCDGGNYILRCR